MDGRVSEPSVVKQSDDDVLAEARERFREARDADEENRFVALDDLKFLWNYKDWQWPTEAKQLRRNRPCLTENRLPQFVRQIVNNQRANRPSITVVPADSQAGPEVAKIIEGVIRHIEQWSKADLAYDNAFEAAVSSSVGYFRITTEYVDDESFEQEICIRPIENPFSVYDDPRYQMPDASDRKYCFVTEMVDRKEFEAEYGFEPTSIDEVAVGDDWAMWFERDQIRVAEYWRLRTETKTIEGPPSFGQEEPQTRDVKKSIVEQFLMTGDRIIKRTEWPGTMIPIIPVFGEQKNIEGKKLRKSLIRDAKDAQRVNNYFLSAEVETTALQPKAPYIGVVGQFETDKERWENAHLENYPYLEVDMVDGAPGLPQRQPPPQFPDGLRSAREGAVEGMKAMMGIYDASLGARSNEVSGVAIDERQQQGDFSTYHFIDNMMRAIRYAGSVIIDLLPKIYSAPRVARIIAPDGQADMIAINTVFIDPQTYQPGIFDVKAGRYDVVVKSGPSYQTQRQAISNGISDLVKAFPPLMQVAGDLLVKNMDFPDADKVAERLAPPPPGAPKPPPPQVMEAQIKAQADQQMAQIKSQSDQAIQMARAQADMQVEQQKVQMQNALEQAKAQYQMQLQAFQHQSQQQVQIEIAKIQAMTDIEVARIKAMLGSGAGIVSSAAAQTGFPVASNP